MLKPLVRLFNVAPRPETTLLSRGVISRQQRNKFFGKMLRIISNPNPILRC